MAYRRPGVTVTQVFAAAAPALAAFNLPSVVVGPAYQIVDDDSLGPYAGAQLAFSYASLMGGAQVDLEELSSEEQFPETKKPISVVLKDAAVEILPQQTDGAVSGDVFTDATVNQFDDVLPGDIVVIEETLAISVLGGQTNGVSTNTPGQEDRLTSGVANQFANVKVGDTVTVTAGTNTNTGTYTVLVKMSDSVIKLSANVNDGVGPSTDVAYSITGDRGTLNQGEHRVKTKTDANTLVLESPLADTPEALLTYYIKREVAEIELDRVATLSSNGFVASAGAVTLPANSVLQYEIDSVLYPILSGDLYASYRALRNDLAAEVFEITNTSDINSKFGVGQIVPANPLAYALSLMLQNTVTAINGLGLDGNAVSNETLSYTNATDVLGRTEMYAIAILSQALTVHTLMKNHVEQLSLPTRGLERVVIFNSKLVSMSVLQEEVTTSSATAGARIIVNTQVDGSGALATPTTLTDGTTNQFQNVQPGDSVVIQSGANVTPGTYTVATKTDNNNLILSGSFNTGTSTDIQYYIVRRDGIGADGLTFYDRNAEFITNGVAPGHFIDILTGTYKGRHAIATVDSEKQVTLATAIPGIASLQVAINYQVDRDLSLTEQANYLKGYSESFASRRCVHMWPDVLDIPSGQDIIKAPGFYGPAVVAALTTGLPTHQGLTNLAVSGFLGLDHSTRYFSEEQLDIIADGGTMILAQDKPGLPLYVRHQLTSDRSSIKFQEFSVTKNVDYVAKFLRAQHRPFIGQYNIVDTTLDAIKTTGQALIDFLKNRTRLAKIGGVIRSGSLKSIKESETQIDTLLVTYNCNMPIPLNNIDITLEV